MSIHVGLRFIKVLAVALFWALVLQGCRGSQVGNYTKVSTTSVPPFSTREPESYQAIRAITLGGSASPDSTPLTSVRIARQGQKRRQEYEITGKKLIYLELPTGRFLLSPDEKLYADLKAGPAGLPVPDVSLPVPDISSFNQARTDSRFQRLGPEVVAERSTTKYRVIAGNRNETGPASETLIWVDESLGMPVRSEMRRGTDNSLEVLIELIDIKFEVDEKLFDLPSDYKQVEPGVILDRLRLPAKLE